MKFFRIFLLQWEQALEVRSRSFVYFLITVLNGSIMILYWTGVHHSNPTLVNQQTSIALNTYYLLNMILGTLLISHAEDDISYIDIKEGQLSNYLLKPVSYYWMILFREIPYRIIQGSFGLLFFTVAYMLLPNFFQVHLSSQSILLGIIIMIFAYLLSYTFKIIIALIAFWTVDMGGIFEFIEIVFIIFTGSLLPLYLLPSPFGAIIQTLPFAYMLYFPLRAIQGQLDIGQLFGVIGMQVMWLAVFYFIHRSLWTNGVKRFSGVGQ